MKIALFKSTSKTKWPLAAIVIYGLIFFATRLTNIATFPLYIDEVTHIFVSKLTVEGSFFIGLSETAKQMYIWLVAISFQFFDDPIYAARIVSVLAGLLNATLCYKLTNTFYPDIKVGYLAALFYLVSPFAVLFDRMALADSLQATLMGAGILVSLQLWRSPSVKWALLLGVVFGLAALNKAYAIFYYPTPILLWVVLGKTISWEKIIKYLSITYVTASVAWLVIFIIGQLAYQDYLQKKSIVGQAELDFWNRVRWYVFLMGEWLGSYLTIPLVLLLLFAGIVIFIKQDRAGMVLIMLVLGPLLGFALAFTDLYSRYLFPLIVPLSVLVAWGIHWLATTILTQIKWLNSGNLPTSVASLVSYGPLILVFFLPSLMFSFLILTRPTQAPFPTQDKDSYIARGQSPQGYKEIATLMENLIRQYENLIFLRHDLTGPLEVMLTVYLSPYVTERMNIIPITSYQQTTPEALDAYARQAPTLTIDRDLIMADTSDTVMYAPLWKLTSFDMPYQTSTVGVYQWLLPPDFAIRWLQQGGDKTPRLVADTTDTIITTPNGLLIDWPEVSTPEAMNSELRVANAEYILVTPELVKNQPGVFAPFITTDGTKLTLKQFPPGWRLAFAYPELNCRWCLFQLKPPSNAVHVIYGDSIQLAGYDLSALTASLGEPLYVTFYWQSLKPVAESYVIFVHLLDANGNLVDQVDETPLMGLWPTNHWRVGDRLADRHVLNLDSTLPPGDYTLAVGWYHPVSLERMSVQSAQKSIMNNAVYLSPTITVKGLK